MNVWLNRKKMGRLAHLTYGCGWADIHLPAVYSVSDVCQLDDVVYVQCWFGVESERKLIWFDEDLLILDGKHYRRNSDFFSIREKRLGVFFYLRER